MSAWLYIVHACQQRPPICESRCRIRLLWSFMVRLLMDDAVELLPNTPFAVARQDDVGLERMHRPSFRFVLRRGDHTRHETRELLMCFCWRWWQHLP